MVSGRVVVITIRSFLSALHLPGTLTGTLLPSLHICSHLELNISDFSVSAGTSVGSIISPKMKYSQDTANITKNIIFNIKVNFPLFLSISISRYRFISNIIAYQIKCGKKIKSTYYLRYFLIYCPVYDFLLAATSSGVPLAITVPPLAPPSGPMSII